MTTLIEKIGFTNKQAYSLCVIVLLIVGGMALPPEAYEHFFKGTVEISRDVIREEIEAYIDQGLGGSPWQTAKQATFIVGVLSVSGTDQYFCINGSSGKLWFYDTRYVSVMNWAFGNVSLVDFSGTGVTGGSVFQLAGNYNATEHPILIHDNTRWWGEGEATNILIDEDIPNFRGQVNNADMWGAKVNYDIEIDHLSFDGRYATQTFNAPSPIHMDGVKKLSIHHNAFHNVKGYGIYITSMLGEASLNTSDVEVYRNYCDYAEYNFIAVVATHSTAYIDGVDISENVITYTDTGISIYDNVHNSKIMGNWVYNNTNEAQFTNGIGIVLEGDGPGPYGTVIDSNVVRDQKGGIVSLTTNDDTIISNNILINNEYGGTGTSITFWGMNRGVIADNDCLGGTGVGSRNVIFSGENVTVSGNTIQNGLAEGALQAYGTGHVITGNRVRGGWDTMILTGVNYSIISDNYFTEPTAGQAGLRLENGAHDNKIEGNYFRDCPIGVEIPAGSTNNHILDNTFVSVSTTISDGSGLTEIWGNDPAFDFTGLGDHSYGGHTITIQAGEAISRGEIVFLDGDGGCNLPDANSTTTMYAIGVALEDIANTAYGEILVMGYFRDDTWAAQTVGSETPIMVSWTPGAMTQIVPNTSGDQVQRIGYALGSKIVYFDFDSTVVEIA